MKKIFQYIIIIAFSIIICSCAKEPTNITKEELKGYVLEKIDELSQEIDSLKNDIETENIEIIESSVNDFNIYIPYTVNNAIMMFTEYYKDRDTIITSLQGFSLLIESISLSLKSDEYNFNDFSIHAYIDIIDPFLENEKIEMNDGKIFRGDLYRVDSKGTVYRIDKNNNLGDIVYKDKKVIKIKLKKENIEKYLEEISNIEGIGECTVKEINDDEFEVRVPVIFDNTLELYSMRESMEIRWNKRVQDIKELNLLIENSLFDLYSKSDYELYDYPTVNLFVDVRDSSLESVTWFSVDRNGVAYSYDGEIIE